MTQSYGCTETGDTTVYGNKFPRNFEQSMTKRTAESINGLSSPQVSRTWVLYDSNHEDFMSLTTSGTL